MNFVKTMVTNGCNVVKTMVINGPNGVGTMTMKRCNGARTMIMVTTMIEGYGGQRKENARKDNSLLRRREVH